MKPNSNNYNPNPSYLRELMSSAKLSQKKAAKLLGLSERAVRYYLADSNSKGYRPAPYVVQYALEQLTLIDII